MSEQTDGKATNKPPEDWPLRQFRGTFVPGLFFESGHCLWYVEFTATPTEVGPYTELLLLEPDGGRALYADPEAATELALRYHEFDRAHGATIDTERPSSDSLAVTIEGQDGATLDFEITFGTSPRTRAMNVMATLLPGALVRTDLGATLGSMALDLVVGTNGAKIAGRTETGARYRFESDQVRQVTDASATLDGTDLGKRVPPTRSIDFGDVAVTDRPLSMSGDIYLPVPE